MRVTFFLVNRVEHQKPGLQKYEIEGGTVPPPPSIAIIKLEVGSNFCKKLEVENQFYKKFEVGSQICKKLKVGSQLWKKLEVRSQNLVARLSITKKFFPCDVRISIQKVILGKHRMIQSLVGSCLQFQFTFELIFLQRLPHIVSCKVTVECKIFGSWKSWKLEVRTWKVRS